jgi:hypothetical protein
MHADLERAKIQSVNWQHEGSYLSTIYGGLDFAARKRASHRNRRPERSAAKRVSQVQILSNLNPIASQIVQTASVRGQK